MNDYQKFLEGKQTRYEGHGITVPAERIHAMMFPFQRDLVRWALGKGRAALFAGTGLGKTLMQTEWARIICEETGGDVLILAPLAVAQQTVREAAKIGVAIRYCRDGADVRPGITITNYEMLSHFDASRFAGVVIDESSCLKAYTSKFRNEVIDTFAATPYKLACTATPAPNDYMELGNHAEFLGVMSRVEMLSMYFVHDGGDTQKWRLKGHAVEAFWKWVASWAATVRKPSDMGYPDGDFALPPLHMREHKIEACSRAADQGALFAVEAATLTDQRHAKRDSMADRVARVAELVNAEPSEPWIVWCELNAESEALAAAIPGAVEVTGSDSAEAKEAEMLGFADGSVRVLVSKSSICGFGMNWQHCARVAFVGVSHSFEQTFQAIRRCWRFGQTRPVECHMIFAETEGAILRNLQRKEREAEHMAEEMIKQMQQVSEIVTGATARQTDEYRRDTVTGTNYTAHLGDCVEVLSGMTENSIDFSIFSPPFGHSLYTYSNTPRDMGNGRSYREFANHYRFMARELFRVLKAGRLVSVHCMMLPLMKERDGVIGIFDFRGSLIRIMERVGFIYHSEVTIRKDPVTQMQRTKALGLLYKQVKKDTAMSRQALSDYLITFRKPGVNTDPITKRPDDFSVDLWQNYAETVWDDINPSDTLQRESAREEKDERHICPLQLEVIRRAIRLWTNPGDTVLSPFMGIGSEGYVSLQLGRRFVGVELKRSYYEQCVRNLDIVDKTRQMDLFEDNDFSGGGCGGGLGSDMDMAEASA